MAKIWRDGRAGVKLAMLMAVAAIGLSGCGVADAVDPIDWYRDLSGASANDVKDQGANTQNLAAGSKEPYPNLASVPKPPDNAITKADREKMAKGLVADRQNAQYTDEQLHAGQDMSAIAPPAPEQAAKPPAKTAVAPSPKAASAPPAASAPKSAAVAPVKQETLPPAAPAPKVAAVPPKPAPAPKVAAASPPRPAPKVAAASSPPATMAPIVDQKDLDQKKVDKKKPDDKKAADEAKKKKEKEAKIKRGSEAPPAESSLRPPSIGALPQGEDVRGAPPPPPGTPGATVRSARAPRSEEMAAATPPRSDVEAAAPPSKPKPQTAEIRFTPGPYRARILAADHQQLVQLAAVVRRNNGRIRVVGYGGAPAAGDPAQREFQSFNAALDNAKAVGIELAKLGVPPSRIDIETNANVNSPDRAEVFVEY